jgi:hypothetical protein
VDALTNGILLLDRKWGKKIMLPKFLDENKENLNEEFGGLSKDNKREMLTEYRKAKEEKKKALKNLSNISISKTVDTRMKLIATAVCPIFFLDMTLIQL